MKMRNILYLLIVMQGSLLIGMQKAQLPDPVPAAWGDLSVQMPTQQDLASFLGRNAANVHATFNGHPLIYWAVIDADPAATELLLMHGADQHYAALGGMSLLHIMASRLESPAVSEITQLLVNHNVDIDAQDSDGKTPLIRASGGNILKRTNPFVVQLLLEEGADRDVQDDAGRVALDYAINNDQLRTLFAEIPE